MSQVLNRREFVRRSLAVGALAALSPHLLRAQATPSFAFQPEENLIPAPDDPADWPAFRQRLADWRSTRRRELNYNDALYRRPDFAWVASCFTCGFVMLNDERFLDARRGRFRVESFIADERKRFGGYDAVVLWQAYPRIGLDDRNQFDFYRQMPGGLEGLRAVVRRLHRLGVRAFICYNPWDTGTRADGQSHLQGLIELIREIEADGIFLDTMNRAGREFRAQLDQARPGVALESEIALPLENIHDHHLSWAQWFADSRVPGILRNKWFERRHKQHQIRRWDWDHSAELHTAWMNGSGMMVWENVFGQWVGWNKRDQSILRAMQPIQHQFVRWFTGPDWTPLVPTQHPEVFASEWGDTEGRLWTLVNRSEHAVEGPLLKRSHDDGEMLFDLIRGQPAATATDGPDVLISGDIPARGIGCFYSLQRDLVSDDFRKFLKQQAKLHARYETDATPQPSKKAVLITTSLPRPLRSLPADMVRIPAATFEFTQQFQVRECGFYEPSPDRPIAGAWLQEKISFRAKVALKAYAMDLTPVTNRQFARFLKASGYRPRLPLNFLQHWVKGKPPAGLEEHPVVFVALEDARAYARWAGKRLPGEAEWQYAAQGSAALRYPWGDADDPARRNGGQNHGTTPVTEFPNGRSPFGLYDCCGNVWELTESEHSDGRNRFVMLKGGGFYRAEGSLWYFDGGPQPNQHVAKQLLFWPGLDRCATVGFRCAADWA